MDVITSLGALGIVYFLIAISVIIAVHEYGHYIVGRWCGIHAEVFSLGFGKVLLSRVDRHGTRWQIAAVPLGGFVRFLGDGNAASAGADAQVMAGLDPASRRRSMPGAPLWARAATVAAGPIFNFILASAIFTGISLTRGIAVDPPVIGAVRPLPWTGQLPQPGDQILAIGDQKITDLKSLFLQLPELPEASSMPWTVKRGDEIVTFEGPHPQAPLVDQLAPRNAGIAAGIEPGDVILSADGQPIPTFATLTRLVQEGEGAPMTIRLWRAGKEVEVTLSPNMRDLPTEDGFERRWLIGIYSSFIFDPQTRAPSLWEAASRALERAYLGVETSLSGMKHLLLGKIDSCNLGGAVTMAQSVTAAADHGWVAFLGTIAMLSLGIGLINLFPIPVLDGGHLALYAYEAVFRHKPSDAILGRIFAVGFALVMSLMAFGLFNDFTCK